MEASKKKSRDLGDSALAGMGDVVANKGSEFTQEGPYKKYRFDGNTKEEQIQAVTQELNALEQSLALEGHDGRALQHVDGDLSLALKPCVEVFVGGLPPDVQEEAVKEAFSAVGDVLGVKIFKKRRSGECRGYGYVSFPDIATAEKACQQVSEVAGAVIGVHVSRGKATQDLPDIALGLPPVPVQSCDAPDASINQLLTSLRKQNDKVAAVAAAVKAAATSARRRTPARPSAPPTPGAAPSETPAAVQQADDIPDNYLDTFPKCKKLVEQFRSHPNTHNKTPLAILHEYATRLNLELNYEEKSDTALGPFVVDARLSSVGGAILYASGTGKGRNKKDAKQYAASAVLEVLLQNVPESEFMHPGKAKQTKATARPSHVSDANTHQMGPAAARKSAAVGSFNGSLSTGPQRTAGRGSSRPRAEGPNPSSRSTSLGTGGRFSGRTRTYSQYSQPSYPQSGGGYQGGYGAQPGGLGQQSGFGPSSGGAGMGGGFGSQPQGNFGAMQSGYSAGTGSSFQQPSYQGSGSYPQAGYQSSGGYPQSNAYHSSSFQQPGYGLGPQDPVSLGEAMPLGVGRGGGVGNPMMAHDGSGLMGGRSDPYGAGYSTGGVPVTPVSDTYGRPPAPEPYTRSAPADPYARAPAVDPYARGATGDGYGRAPAPEPYHRSPVSDTYGRAPGPTDMYPKPMAAAEAYPRSTPTPDMYGRSGAAVDAYGRTPGSDGYGRSPAADSYGRQAANDSYGRGYGQPNTFDTPSQDYAVLEPQHKRNMRNGPAGSATPPTAAVGNLSISPGYGQQDGGHNMYGSMGGMQQQGMGGDFSMGSGAGGYSNGYGGEYVDMHGQRGMRPMQFDKQQGRGGFNSGQQQQQQHYQGRLMRP